MSNVSNAEKALPVDDSEMVINDFQIIVATVNGTGSQTANTVLIRALFRMGIPVNGKNIFPSNIQGLPTWFTIRVNHDGYIARRETSEVLVAMNMASLSEDIANLPAGGVCFYPEEWKIRHDRDDIIYYAIPVSGLVKDLDIPRSLQDYVSNMVYVGALSAMLGIELGEIEAALNFHFAGKPKPVELNMRVVRAASDWAMDHLPKADAYQVKRLDMNQGKILLDGNSAGGLGAVFGGVSFVAWYPITPSTSLIDATREYLKELRIDEETGEATFAVIQAEDELAAIGMTIGAGWAGARSMTATSGPGISLMAEFTGLAYFAEVPTVIWDVQRVGPSTGLPTRASQGDLLFTYTLGHGDTKQVILLPANLEECFEFGWRSFDIAERLQTPVFVLSDLDLGMNLWMGDTFKYPDTPLDRGKLLTSEDLDKIEDYGRYKDTDGDGIAYRTLPGTDHVKAAYFARGTGHDEYAFYSEKPEDWTVNMDRLKRKYETARTIVPEPILQTVDGTKIGVIAFGSTDSAVIEGRDRLEKEGVKFNYLRVRALPLNQSVKAFIETNDRVYVFENNSDGQMASIIHMEYPKLAHKVTSLAYLDGMPLSARKLTEMILDKEQ